ncbi:MAG: protein kinase, partial [Spirochaetota bacterium]
EQEALERKIVVKLLSEDYAEDPEIRERFLQEAKTPARIKHPNLVEVIDVGVIEDRPYYIMEYAPGGSLSDKLKQYKDQGQAYPIKDSIYVISKVLRALDYCHNNRLSSHRDIKPDNIMFRATGEPIIMDFGIAKIAGEFRTQTRMTLGTANYMSPEQCRGSKDIDGRSDVYAVGIMLFELLTGDVPFKGDSGISVMGKHVNSRVPDLSLKVKDSPYKSDISSEKLIRRLEAVVRKACAKKKEKRYQTALAFAEALEKLTNESPSMPRVATRGGNNNSGLIAAMLFLGLGLGSLLVYKFFMKQPPNVLLKTKPVGAEVFRSDSNEFLGKTPYSERIKRPGIYSYKVSMLGYEDKLVSIEISDLNLINSEDIILRKEATLPPENGESSIATTTETNTNTDTNTKINANTKTSTKTNTTINLKEPVKIGRFTWQVTPIPKLNWASAVAYCQKRGMQLPTKSELKQGFNSGNSLFRKPCCEYWTSTEREDDPEEAYNITTNIYGEFFSHKSNRFYVRCVKK